MLRRRSMGRAYRAGTCRARSACGARRRPRSPGRRSLRRSNRSHGLLIRDRNQQTITRRPAHPSGSFAAASLPEVRLNRRATEAKVSPSSTRCMRHDARRSAGIRSSAALICWPEPFGTRTSKLPGSHTAQQSRIHLHQLPNRGVRQVGEESGSHWWATG